MYVFRYDDGDNMSDLAKAGTKVLETGVVQYYLKFGEYPRKLEDLVNPPDGPPLVDSGALLDQWDRSYQYDPTGPRYHGKKPDIWTTGPDGELLGNWPEPRHWWDW
jgi:Type II secretion system (T2SS), protein G